jgi:hypothetical protein
LAIWLIAMAISAVPAVTAVPGIIIDLRPEPLAHQIEAAGAFKDLYFLIMVAGILAISNIVDNLFRRKFDYTSAFQFGAIIAVCCYVLLLIYGMMHFLTLRTIVPEPVFVRDYWVIVFTLGLSAAVEVFIAFNDT